MSTTEHVTEQAGHRSERLSRGLNWWQAIGAAAIGATIVNLLILFLPRAGGGSLELIDAGSVHVVRAVDVINASVVPLVVGTALAALLARWWPGFLRLGQVIGGALGLLTVAGPLMADTDTATRLALAAMHVVVAVAVVLGLEAIRRWRDSAAGPRNAG